MNGNPGPGYADHPEHKVLVVPYEGLVAVEANGQPLASSHQALVMRETGYGVVYYIPRNDVQMTRLQAMPELTYCPFKGEAHYFALTGEQRSIAWSYEQPYDEVSSIRDHLAFYPDRVDGIRVLPSIRGRIPPF